MATILRQGAVCDGFDVLCAVTLDGDGDVRWFHFPQAPPNVQAAVNALEAAAQTARRSPVDVTAEDGTLIHWPPGAPPAAVQRTLLLSPAQTTTLMTALDNLTTHVSRVADVWASLPDVEQRAIAAHSPVLRRMVRLAEALTNGD